MNAMRDISQGLAKLPPSAPELEDAILGALLIETDKIHDVVGLIKPEHFYKESHKIIFEAILSLYQNAEPIDMRTVVARLRKMGKLEAIGGAFAIADISSKISSASNIEYHSRIVIEMAIKRNLIVMASKIHSDAYEDTTDVFELLDKTQKSLDQVTTENMKGDFRLIGSIYNEEIADIEKSADIPDHVVGIHSGLLSVDRLTHGFMKTELTIIAARPGMGKTAIVISILVYLGKVLKIAVGFFSLEMSTKEVFSRMLSMEGEINLESIRTRRMDSVERRKLREGTTALQEAPIYIDDNPSLNEMELRARARRLVREHKVQIIFVDYLQLMTSSQESWSRENEVATISRTCKIIAKELNIPVIVLSQLSRETEKRGGSKRPMLADLRESGAIEQDADGVWFLYRPEYYGIKQYPDGSPTQGVMEVIIAKQRNGGTGTAQVAFVGKFTKVENQQSELAAMQSPLIDFTQGKAKNEDPDLLPF